MKNGIIKVEEELLLELCRLDFNDKNLKKVKSLVLNVRDWDYFKNLANVHGVAALAWNNLERQNLLDGIPYPVQNYLRNTLMISLSRNTFNTEAMGEVLRLMNKNNIKTVILKGLALENSIYGNSGLRQMSDVDILIARKECMRAREILISNGYRSLPVKSFFHKIILAYAGKHLPSLIKSGTSVEIHHDLFGGINDELTRILYESSYEVEIKGEKAWFPQPQLFFIYLVRHLWLHELNNESQLRLYTDLVILLEKNNGEILNPDLISLAADAGISDILADHLEVLRDIWDIEFPGWLNDFICNFSGKDFIKKFIFFVGSPKDNLPCDRPRFYRNLVKEIPGFHRRFLFILGDIFPSFTFMKDRYGCNSNWRALRYYPHRFGKLLWLIRK